MIGPPAVGKTTLAEILAAELPAEIIYEDYAGNPFLAESYLGNAEAKLPAQLYCLMSRAGQLSVLSWPDSGLRVSDYGFCQDRIYASRQLSVEEIRLYNRIAGRLERLVKRPDLVVHLDAGEDVLLARIAERGRGFEKAFTRGFLASMRAAYDEAAKSLGCESIAVNCDRVDLHDSISRAELVEEVRRRL
jgi:deoxyadenosine/deoxycytidine kinase